jgi:transposase-like protein
MSRGRPPLGPGLADRVEGSAPAKERLKIMLATISGQMSVAEACEKLGVGEARFHELRAEWLQNAAALLEPKPLGRPATQVTPEAAKVAALERQVRELKIDLRAAQIREELALLMPHVLQPRKGQAAGDDRRKRLDALQEAEKKGSRRQSPSSGGKNSTASDSRRSGKC